MNSELIRMAKENGFLLSPDFPDISLDEMKSFLDFAKENFKGALVLSRKHYEEFLSKRKLDFKKEVVVLRSKKEEKIRKEIEGNVKIVKAPKSKGRKRELNDFIEMMLDRYKKIKEIFSGRLDPVSIAYLSGMENRNVETVGLIYEIERRKNSVRLKLEDPTGTIDVLITSKSDCWGITDFLVEDMVIGVKGFKKSNVIFANEILLPDIPFKKKETVEDDVWVCFTGDFHFGSKMFLKKEAEMFLKFLNGEIGDEKTRETAAKIKYIVIVGDIVDGVGIYPDQKKELEIPDIYKQYEAAAKYFERIPDDKILIFIPGNHDAVTIAEPQPPLDNEFCKELKERLADRAIFLPNPSYFKIHEKILVLAYHGYSIDKIIDQMPVFRAEGYKNAWKILRFMLQARHLAPKYGFTLQVPEKEDHLVIDIVPDIFVTGHIHYLSVGEYRGVQLLVTSCWQGITEYQLMLGHEPEPGYVPMINLKDRRVRVLSFGG